MSRGKKIADMAIMLAIGVILNLASFPPLGFFGRISLVYAFCYLAGIFLGPFNGMLVAMLGDALGYLLLSHGGPFVPQIMVSNGLMALLAGLSYKYIKWQRAELRFIPGAIVSFFLLTLGLTAWGEAMMLFNIYPYTLAKSIGATLQLNSPYLMIVLSKAATQPFWIVLNILITIIITRRLSTSTKPISLSIR